MVQVRSETLTLKVAEALAKDVGRAIARLDPQDMVRIGAEVGDIIQIVGKKPTVAKVMPAYTQDRGKGTIQIDGITRENAQAGLGEKVEVQRIHYESADTVILTPVTPSSAFVKEKDRKYLGRLLEGLPITPGDKVRVTLLGSRYQEFLVADASPKGAVVVSPLTTIKVKGEVTSGKGKTGITYEDIGGLQKEIQRIREMIELPLKYPEIFERLGIEAPKGVLLHGPPGCGKTLIARAVANETDAYFLHVSGPEVIHKFYGESEAHLRAIFEKAEENAPSIVFLDEIDAIASKREEVRGDQQVERRVVAQLLALMDGLKSRGQVIVIGATNIPNVLDPALRRPGRFDREISISIPDKNGRLEILQIHSRGMPLASDVDLEKLAEITHGFVGADLEALCREAAMVTLRKVMPKIEFEADYIPYELLSELEVTMNDFLEALKEVEPSAIREVFTEIPDVKWTDVGGLEEAKKVLMETIEWPLKYPELFKKAKAKPAKGILLTGPPGTGKTLLAKAVARESGVNFISVKGPTLLSKWVGESERGVREVFKKAKQASPCIIFFDEIDAIAPVRGSSTDSHVTERVVSQLLTELDGIEELKGIVVLGASNRPDIIDPALLRPGRFDVQLELPVPDEKARIEIFKIHTRGKPLANDVELETLAKVTEGLVGSDIEGICRKASMLAIREFLDRLGSQKTVASEISTFKIAAKHFEQAIDDIRKKL
ncbi:MAG: CDC48 family AAA ATPase [Coprothermobacterota bacterium]|nr:CDC48 family AAA ATPase [Coprothermobacterota bacterium]